MSEGQAAAAVDRLPWLADEPKSKVSPAKPAANRRLIGAAAGTLLLVAGVSFWLGSRPEVPAPQSVQPRSVTTVPLPEPRPPSQEVAIAPQPEVRPVATPEVRPAPAPEVRIAAPPARKAQEADKSAAAEQDAVESSAEAKVLPAPAKPAEARPVPLRPWQPRVVAGASGRLVEVGAFGSVQQAKLGWRYMVRSYPAVSRLPAVVRPARNSKGRVFYRFRVGTTSQAHSEVLCQRMQTIHLSCAVVGLPWKAKVER